MSIYAAPGLTYEASASNFPTGLTGTIGVRVTDGIGGTTTSRTTSGIAEFPAGSGIYTVTLTAPTSAGQYQVVWDSGGGSPTWATEELVVTSSSPGGSTPSGIDLCTLSDVREALELPASDTTRDALIQTLISVGSLRAHMKRSQDLLDSALSELCNLKMSGSEFRPTPDQIAS